ncbi:MAG: DUF547 domain-containing protein [Planctomycetota bacterium]
MIHRIESTVAAIAAAVILVAPIGAQEPAPQPEFDHSHAGLTAVLEAVLKDGLVDYATLRRSPDALDAYLAGLEATTPADHARWSRDERFAFWINAYNAYTLQLIRDRGPVKSIKKLGGLFGSPWKKEFIPLAAFDPDRKGKRLTLDEIEHEILRPTFEDARLHAAVNCASLGCPPLRREAYVAERLDAQLADQVLLWLLDGSRNRVRPERGSIRVSKIFDWFEDDFGGRDERVVRWIADQVEAKEPALASELRSNAPRLDVRYLSYDWSINAQKDRR